MVECVEGNPYSKAADPDMVIRVSGGDSGLGRQTRSLTKPLQKTPKASIWTSLYLSAVVTTWYQDTYARPSIVCPHQKQIGSAVMKNVCVPKLAVMAKYESRVGDRTVSCIFARYGVSHRTKGNSACRSRNLHFGSFRTSDTVSECASQHKVSFTDNDRNSSGQRPDSKRPNVWP